MKNASLSLFIIKLVMVLAVFLLPCGDAKADSCSIAGIIKDENMQPLAGAHIYLHETNQGAFSDEQGKFCIRNIKKGKYHIHISFVGYKSQTLDLILQTANNPNLEIILQKSSLELNELIIESNPMKLSQEESSLNIQVLNQESLLKNHGITLMQSLEQVAGVNSINMGVAVSKPVIRGLSGNRVLVNQNGIKQEGQQWGGDHGLEIDQFDLERIEIIKGPNSLLYGSDAMGGVINIKAPKIYINGTHQSEVLVLGRSLNQSLGLSAFAAGAEKDFFYRVRISAIDYGDYKVPADNFIYNTYVLPIHNRTLKNTAGRELHNSIQLGINKNWGYSSISISNYNQKIGIFPGAIGIPRFYQLTDDGNNRNVGLPSQDINHFKIISNSNIKIKNAWLELDFAYQNNLRSENSVPHAHGYAPDTNNTTAHFLRLETISGLSRLNIPQGKNMEAITGVSGFYQWHNYSGFEFLLPRFSQKNLAFYYVEKIKLKKNWTINAGLRFDLTEINIEKHVQTTANGNSEIRNPDILRDYLNYSLGAGFSKKIGHFTLVKFNFGKSFRTPTPQELSANGVHHGSFRHERGSDKLNPEEGLQFDVNLDYERKDYKISLSPYYNYFSNFIYLRPTGRFSPLPEAGQLYEFTEGPVIHWGGEISGEYHPTPSLHLQSAIAYTQLSNTETQLPLPFIPPLSIRNEIDYEFELENKKINQINFRVSYQYFAAQNRVDRNERTTPAYQLINAGMGLNPLILKREISFSLQINNLLNTAFFNHISRWRQIGLPEPGRNISLYLKIPINKK